MGEHWKELLPKSLVEKYELYNFNSAVEILTQSHSEEFFDIIQALEGYRRYYHTGRK